jgi:hypothetical protein
MFGKKAMQDDETAQRVKARSRCGDTGDSGAGRPTLKSLMGFACYDGVL